MAYTHTFQLTVNSIDFDGELEFIDNGKDIKIKTESDMELPLTEWQCVQKFFHELLTLYRVCNKNITKIEITEKP